MKEKSLMDDTVCLQLSFGKPGDKTRADKSMIEVDADKKQLHLTKNIIDSPELKKIASFQQSVRMWVRSIAIPSPVFRFGVHSIPIGLIEIVEEKLTEARKQCDVLIGEFLDAYEAPDGLVAQAKKKLKRLFDKADYPSSEKMKRAFRFEWNYFTFQTPENLNSVSSSFFKQEKEKMSQKWQEAQEEVIVLLRAEFQSLIDHMLERLEPEANINGKRKKFFKDATITSVTDFLGTFPFRNVCNDSDLDSLVVKAKGLLDGIDTKELRKSDKMKAGLSKNFVAMKKKLDKLVKDKPTRLISLEEEE